MEWNLLEKTTFWIEGISLDNVDLRTLSSIAGKVLSLGEEEIIVVDVRPNLVVFDVLKQNIKPESVVGRSKNLLMSLEKIQGVVLYPDTQIHSEGILGLIAIDNKEAVDILDRSSKMTNIIIKKISKRVAIFASGTELLKKRIRDTNSPYLMKILNQNGFNTKYAGILPDDPDVMTSYLEDTLNEGFGYIIITGGTGAEDKDCTVDAIKKLVSNPAYAYILKFNPGSKYAAHYHHQKEGVKIAVGTAGNTKIVALPGPHEEIELIIENLINGMNNDLNDKDFAEVLAAPLRQKWNKIFENQYKENKT